MTVVEAPSQATAAGLVERDRVHGSVYTSQEMFDAEMDRIFGNGWVFVAHDSEIPEAGDYVTRRMGRQPIIVSRVRDGSVSVLSNRCAHRGNRVCDVERGSTSSFRCPYHGWTYAADGRLVAVPMKQGYGDRFDAVREELGLTAAPRVDSYGGFVFASFSPTGVSLREHLGKATAAFDRLLQLSPTGKLDLTAGWMKHHQRCNWKMVMENNVDGYHALFTHQSVYDAVRPAKVSHQPSRVDVLVRDIGNGHAEIDYSEEYTKLDEEFVWFGRTPRAQLTKYVQSMEAIYGAEKTHRSFVIGPPHTLIFPNLFLAEMNVMVVEPVGPAETIASTTPAFLKGAPELNRKMLRRTEGAMGPAGFLIADDGEIGRRNQLGLEARQPEWVHLSRGLESDVQDQTGVLNRDKSAETPQRGFWHHWAQVMGAPVPETAR
jgi:phenylpropionate dioxygenase-like ring-hydroxylating dioxygenase large terminal subunit